MRIKPAGRLVRVQLGEHLLAEADRALRVMEIGRDLYDPVLYLPRDGLKVRTERTERSTHCPLKGDASYDDVLLPNGERLAGLIWSYTQPLPFAQDLAGLVAFYGDRVAITEAPLG